MQSATNSSPHGSSEQTLRLRLGWIGTDPTTRFWRRYRPVCIGPMYGYECYPSLCSVDNVCSVPTRTRYCSTDQLFQQSRNLVLDFLGGVDRTVRLSWNSDMTE